MALMAQWTGVEGKRVVITGATGGIGLAAAEALATRGAQLTIIARSEARATVAVRRIEAAGGNGVVVDPLFADLASQSSVRQLAAQLLSRYPRIDVLVNNAGAVYPKRRLSDDGIELTWALNHLAPFLLTKLLLERIKDSRPARIVTTASGAHNGATIPFDDIDGARSLGRGFRRYGQTKLANILFTVELARRLEGTGVTANCFHPGVVATGFSPYHGPAARAAMKLARPFMRSPAKGAETLVWLVDSPTVEDLSGRYFMDEQLTTPSEEAQDVEAARRLWELSEAQVARSVEKPARAD
jgi:NAD(P)-dependent dehydrogenase (short-subunit alcohol dehydrogenase family)